MTTRTKDPRRQAAAVRPVDHLFALYAGVSGVALLFPHRPAVWPLLAALHLTAALAALRVPPLDRWLAAAARRRPGLGRLIHDWYPLLLIPALYGELAVLNRGVWGGRYFDPLILRWEAWVFGGQPSQTLARVLPNVFLSEFLHGAYLSYYLIIYGPPLVLYLSGRLAAYRAGVFTLMLTFFVHYLFFIYFPVQGPRYLFPAPGGELAGGALYRLTHVLLEAGSSQGAAFPSSHVAVATAQCVVVARFLHRLLPLIAVLTAGLALGAVYGGFHYATDVTVGFLLGLALAMIAPAVARAFEPKR